MALAVLGEQLDLISKGFSNPTVYDLLILMTTCRLGTSFPSPDSFLLWKHRLRDRSQQ